MNTNERSAIIIELSRRLRSAGSWCGETHIQKATYLLEELTGLDLGFEFVLYKHGPYSFDLHDELVALRADGLLEQQPRSPYGPTLTPTASAEGLAAREKAVVDGSARALDLVTEAVGDKDVFNLEQLATALFVIQEDQKVSEKDRANRLRDLKPHVTEEAAVVATKEIDGLRARWPSDPPSPATS